jgi:hypothetical protein
MTHWQGLVKESYTSPFFGCKTTKLNTFVLGSKDYFTSIDLAPFESTMKILLNNTITKNFITTLCWI